MYKRDMIVFAPPDIPLQVEPENIFPLEKYRLVRERLLTDGSLKDDEVLAAPLLDMRLAQYAHAESYCHDVVTGNLSPVSQRRIGFPWSENLVLRARYASGATLAAAYTALKRSVSGGLAGGTHHAHSDFGFGYCVFNDLAITAKVLVARGAARRVAVIDLDFHPGDGTAQICRGDSSIYTLSIHGRSILARDPVGSTVDVELSWGREDEEYLDILAAHLPGVSAFSPELAMYQAGSDVLAGDKLGKFRLSPEGMRKRDELVFRFCRDRSIPVAFTLGGGYNNDTGLMVEAHASTVRTAKKVFEG